MRHIGEIVKGWYNSRSEYLTWLKHDLADCNSILELGCGSYSPLLKIGYGFKTDALDIFQPYVDKHNAAHNFRKCWQADICNMEWPAENSYDAVVIFDVMEHLPRPFVENGNYLFKNMERCARKKVICFTPNGFIENDLVDDDPWQEHISAWMPEDYIKRGYKVRGATGFRFLFGVGSRHKYRPYWLFAHLGLLSVALVHYWPGAAWHSYAVKEIGNE